MGFGVKKQKSLKNQGAQFFELLRKPQMSQCQYFLHFLKAEIISFHLIYYLIPLEYFECWKMLLGVKFFKNQGDTTF